MDDEIDYYALDEVFIKEMNTLLKMFESIQCVKFYRDGPGFVFSGDFEGDVYDTQDEVRAAVKKYLDLKQAYY